MPKNILEFLNIGLNDTAGWEHRSVSTITRMTKMYQID